MKKNLMRVVCNPYTNKMSYYFKNEIGEWSVLSGSSPLSRQFYTNTSVKERGKEIVEKIDEIYNRKNRGIDILFEGTSDSYKCFVDIIKNDFAGRDINCALGTTKIAVLGKIGVGKTTLIKGLESLKKFDYSITRNEKYIKYTDDCNHAHWYEIKGIDFGTENVEKAFQTVAELSEEGLSAVIFCVSAMTGKIEDIEKELISRIESSFTELKVMVVLTQCYIEDVQETIDAIEKITNQAKLVSTLAKEYEIRKKDNDGMAAVIKPFGLEKVSEYVFEGR